MFRLRHLNCDDQRGGGGNLHLMHDDGHEGGIDREAAVVFDERHVGNCDRAAPGRVGERPPRGLTNVNLSAPIGIPEPDVHERVRASARRPMRIIDTR